ncbi:uncharacterized protein PV09_09092 [Verruconis gallopava]|uniref:Major facilitator superfamily (MFS) profile domain-containing protein n=1 Tax=Verruconis gallopava TaxID=253628 RepID=A0A0D2AJV3_9PEZI|nr:uncharacterized protein PV09_09092 [Verruconis gallopava]KIV99228.1 hypothetical protein PV09_09092 [Verruconis gallopava]
MSVKEMKSGATHNEYAGTADAALAQLGQNIVETERGLSVVANARKHWRVLLISCVTLTSAAIFGFDVVVNGASISMPAFLLYFGDKGPKGLYLPSVWSSLWTAMSSLTQAIGAIICGWVIDKLGRKWPASFSAGLTLAGTAVQYTATTRPGLMAGKMVSGFGIGAVVAIATTYIGEIAPLRLRAPLQTVLVMSIIFIQGAALGCIRAYVPNIHETSFRHVFAIQWAFGGIAVICWALAPESPVYLAKRGKIEAARKAMTRIYGQQNSPNERLEYVIRTLEEERQIEQGGTYLSCLKGQELKRTLTVAFLYSTANIGGAALLNQNIYVLIIAGLAPIHAFDIGIGGFGLAILIMCSSGLYLKKISRRTTVFLGLILNLIIMVVIGALYYAHGQGPLWAIAALMNLLISLQTATLSGAGWPIAAEIPSYRLRAKTLSIGIFAQTLSTWIFLFTTPYMYNVDSGNLGTRTGFVYAGATVLMLVIAWIIVPDTTGMTTEEIDNAYEAKLAPRKFQQFKSSTNVPSSLNPDN